MYIKKSQLVICSQVNGESRGLFLNIFIVCCALFVQIKCNAFCGVSELLMEWLDSPAKTTTPLSSLRCWTERFFYHVRRFFIRHKTILHRKTREQMWESCKSLCCDKKTAYCACVYITVQYEQRMGGSKMEVMGCVLSAKVNNNDWMSCRPYNAIRCMLFIVERRQWWAKGILYSDVARICACGICIVTWSRAIIIFP